MSQITLISRQRHAGKKWLRASSSFQFASKAALAPIIDLELGNAARSMPLAFIQQGGQYTLVAVLSLAPERNMMVAPNGRWLGGYVPAYLRFHPFCLIRKDGTSDAVVGVYEGGGLVVDSDSPGEDFFDKGGNVSPALQKIVDFMEELDRRQKATDAAVNALANAGVIQSWNITAKTKERDQTIPGLCRIDQAALNALADDAFLKLRKTSALPIAYSQLLSMSLLGIFEHLATLHNQPAPSPLAALPETLDGLLENLNVGMIRLD